MSKPDELLPCPFCGGTNLDADPHPEIDLAECQDCRAYAPFTKWNTRTPTPSPTVAEVEKPCSCFGSFRPCNPNCPCGNADATGACVACGKNLEVGHSNPPPASVDVEQIAEKCLDRLFGYNKEPAWIRAKARTHNEAVIKSAFLESTAHLQSKVEELEKADEELHANMHLALIGKPTKGGYRGIANEVKRKLETLKQQLASARDELNRQRNICIHHTDKEFGQIIGKCPVCTQQQLAEAGKDSELWDWVRENVENVDFWIRQQPKFLITNPWIAVGGNLKEAFQKAKEQMTSAKHSIANSTKKGQE